MSAHTPEDTRDALEQALYWLMTLPSLIAEEGAADRGDVTQDLIEFIELAHQFTQYDSPARWKLEDMVNGRRTEDRIRKHLQTRLQESHDQWFLDHRIGTPLSEIIPAQTVHALREGLPLCGFETRVPRDWPDGHAWIDWRDFNDPDKGPGNARCIRCIACLLSRITNEKMDEQERQFMERDAENEAEAARRIRHYSLTGHCAKVLHVDESTEATRCALPFGHPGECKITD